MLLAAARTSQQTLISTRMVVTLKLAIGLVFLSMFFFCGVLFLPGFFFLKREGPVGSDGSTLVMLQRLVILVVGVAALI